MELLWKQRLIGGCGVVAATVVGWLIADGSMGLPVMMACAAGLLLANRISSVAPDAFVAGGVLIGYLVGNRGFAQLHPPNLPLLPAEFLLGLALACGAWRWARLKQVPVQRDPLNAMLLLWIMLGAARLPFDVRETGLIALRDFAMVYYGLFFFLAQDWYRSLPERRWLQGSLTLGLALAPVVSFAFQSWPDWFLNRLIVAGNPLIFIKGDVAGGLMAGGVFWFAERYARFPRFTWSALTALSLLGVVASNSRAAVVALGVGGVWLFVLRRWRSLTTVGVICLIGLVGLGMHAAVSDRPWTASPLYRIYQSAASVMDVRGTGVYGGGLEDKPDNNQFRLVWWREVIAETWAEGRWLGLGFGHDLAAEFLKVYYADANDDFSARSPHNFVLSVFGRSGIVGFVALAAVLAAIATATWRAGFGHGIRHEQNSAVGYWLMAWAIFASACFGVVLEGPMGAVVFWIALGLANAATRELAETRAALASEPSDPSLNATAETTEIVSAS